MNPIALLLMLTPDALSFCGAYVGAADAELTNTDSQIAIAMHGGEVTLTLSNDYSGDATDFGLLIPVPDLVTADDVSVVDPSAFRRADAYSAPRLVRYECSWDSVGQATTMSGGCSGDTWIDTGDTSSDELADLGNSIAEVEVHSHFTAGAYEIVVLSAGTEDGLQSWFATHDFALTETTDVALQPYIDQGVYFLAARVQLDVAEQTTWLPPLQIRYTSDMVSLPLGLGATSSSGVQDLVIYGLTDPLAGRLAVANYDHVAVEDECIIKQSIGEHYQTAFNRLHDSSRAQWTNEYAWGAAKCDPCPDEGPLDEETVVALGWTGDPSSAFFSRIHLRYSPDQIDEDLQLYATGDVGSSQIRFIEHNPDFGGAWPTCGEDDGGDYSYSPTCLQDLKPQTQATSTTGLCGLTTLWLLGMAGIPLRRRLM